MRFKDLPEPIQEKLLAAHADSCDCYEWWDGVEDNYKTDGKERGFDIKEMQFSGFSSQGDGACWSGHIDLRRFLDYHLKPGDPQFTQYTVYRELLNDGSVDTRVSVTTSGHYRHQYTMQVETPDSIGYDEEDTISTGILAGANVGELVGVIAPMLNDITEWMQEAARAYAGEYYEALEQEYDWLTSDEALIEQDLNYDEAGEEIDETGQHTEGE